jgi:hypothetical protein
MFSIRRAREALGWEPTDRFVDVFATCVGG